MYWVSEELALWLESMYCWSLDGERTMGEVAEAWRLPWCDVIRALDHLESWHTEGRPIYYLSDRPLVIKARWEAAGEDWPQYRAVASIIEEAEG